MKKLLVAIFLFFVLQSCMHSRFSCCHSSSFISVFPEVIHQKTRASTHVNAPDPLHALNPHGQRFYISWKLPKEYAGKKIEGLLKIRFNEPVQEEIPFKIETLSGTVVYEVINELYFSRKGVFTYSAEIFVEGEKVDQFKHKMWTDLIQVKASSATSTFKDQSSLCT